MSTFPTLSKGQDAKYYKVTEEDPASRTDMDGGIVFTRAKFTRRPRQTFTTGFTDISEADRQILRDFWKEVMGGSKSFSWTDPVTGDVWQVRFKKAIEYTYTGAGGNHRWDVQSIELEEV